MKINLGRVVPVFKGNYKTNQPYIYLDVVYYSGSSYVCLKDKVIGETPGATDAWQMVARAGSGVVTPEMQAEVTANVYDILVNNGVVFDPTYNHTDNNFSDDLKTKVEELNPEAQKNVQADWSETDINNDAYIKNKPTGMVNDSNYVHTDNNFTNAYRDKLISINPNAEANVQADWAETSSSADAFIKNKPTIPTRVSQLTNDALYVTKSATNLDNYPKTTELKSVAFTGNYNDLTSKPVGLSHFNNDAGFITLEEVPAPPTVNISGKEDKWYNVSSNTTSGSVTLAAQKWVSYSTPLVSLTLNGQVVGETIITFTAGTNMSLSYPSNAKWIGGVPIIEAGRKYVIGVFSNLFVINEYE